MEHWRKIPEEIKEKARQEWLEIGNVTEVARRVGVPRMTVVYWTEQWRRAGLEPAARVTRDAEYTPEFMERAKAKWLEIGSVAEAARAVGIPRLTLQEWVSRWRGQGLAPAQPAKTVTEEKRAPVPIAQLGGDLPWREWVARHGARAAAAPMAAHHERAWEWFEALEAGVKPEALIECWPRGGGKSTTVELALARQAVRDKRHFALYVSATQKAANRHIQSTAITMERVGIARAVNKYGVSRGWTSELLRTADGFNVLALGLDAAVRGIKLDNFRPDIILLDDIDELGDSMAVVEGKLDILRHSILPSGSPDVAICFVQNAIHKKSIMSGCMDGSIDALRRRVNTIPVKAVEGLQWEKVQQSDLNVEYRITGGTATWEGKPLDICEAEINDSGIVSFLRECQHDTGVGGMFFDGWDEKRHVIWQEDLDPRRTGYYVGGYDWGYGNPCCFLLGMVEKGSGAITILDEVYQRRLTNPEQAEQVLDVLKRWKLTPDRVTIMADPSMWSLKSDHSGRRVADVEAFHRVGLRFVKASNIRRGGWQNVRRYLREAPGSPHPGPSGHPSPNHPLTRVPGRGDQRPPHLPAPDPQPLLGRILQSLQNLTSGAPVEEAPAPPAMLRVLKGHCANLIRTIPLQSYDPTDVEDLDTTGEDHAVDALRYLLSARPRGVELKTDFTIPQLDGERYRMLTVAEQMATHPNRYEFAPYGHPDYRPPWDRPKPKRRKL